MSKKLISRTVFRRGVLHTIRLLIIYGTVLLSGALSAQVSLAQQQKQDFRPSYLENGLYTEGWDQIFYFPDGTLLIGQFTVTNVSFGDHNAGTLGVLYRPDQAPVIIKKSRSKEKWNFASDRFEFTVLRHRLTGTAPNYNMAIRKVSGEIVLEFTATAPIWRLGRTVQVGDEFQYVSFYAPLAVGRARYRLPEGEKRGLGQWLELGEGTGFAVRYVNSTATDELFRSTTRLVSVEPKGPRPVIYLVQKLDGTRTAHVALFDHGRLLHSTVVPLQMSGSMKNKRFPEDIELDIGDDNFRLTGTIKTNSLVGRLDPVDLLKPYVRVFIRLFNTPVHHRYLANYKLSYANRGGKVQRLAGRAVLDHMLHSESENNR